MKKVSIFLIVIVILVIAGGIVAYTIGSPVYNFFFSVEKNEEREFNRLEKLYPKSIGNFDIYGGTGKIRRTAKECNEVDEELQEDGLKVKGTVCVITTMGEYRDANNQVVFVHFIKITKGGDIPGVESVFWKYATKDKLNGNNIIRSENHEIGWTTEDSAKMNIILTQEGMVRKDSDGGESMLYQNTATGGNPVTKYFIEKYSPVK